MQSLPCVLIIPASHVPERDKASLTPPSPPSRPSSQTAAACRPISHIIKCPVLRKSFEQQTNLRHPTQSLWLLIRMHTTTRWAASLSYPGMDQTSRSGSILATEDELPCRSSMSYTSCLSPPWELPVALRTLSHHVLTAFSLGKGGEVTRHGLVAIGIRMLVMVNRLQLKGIREHVYEVQPLTVVSLGSILLHRG